MIAGLLLAAGSARRFGGASSKLVQDLGGRPVIRWSAEVLLGADIAELLVVVPQSHAEIARALDGLDVRFVPNGNAHRGIGASIACGTAAVSHATQAVLIALGDEPELSAETVSDVVAAYRSASHGVAIVAPRYGDVPGHPALFDRSVFPELLALDGDHGARSIIDRDPGRVAIVQLAAPAPRDVDTVQDLARLRGERQYMSSFPNTTSSRDIT